MIKCQVDLNICQRNIESDSYGALPFITVKRDFPDDRGRFVARALGFVTGR
jgi:hypothetical protein